MTDRTTFTGRLSERIKVATQDSPLQQVRAQWRAHGWGADGVVVEAFGDEKLLATCYSPEQALKLIGDVAGIGAFYLHLNEVDQAKTKAWAGRWLRQKRGVVSVEDDDIRSLRVLPIDIDPTRAAGKGTNATREEQASALKIAARIYVDLAEMLGRDDCLACASSGNGFWVFVMLNRLPPRCRPLIVRALVAVKAIYSDPAVELDTSVSDPRRIGPLAATWKRKAKHTDERPHRRTWIAVPEEVVPIDEGALELLVSTLESRIPPGAVVDRATFRESHDPTRLNADNAFARCNQVRITAVVSHFDDPTSPTCPVCGAHGSRGNTSVSVLDDDKWNHFDCKHATCGGFKAGPAYYVAYQLCGVRELRGDRDAARRVLAWFREKFGVDIEDPPIEIATDTGMWVDDHRSVVTAPSAPSMPVQGDRHERLRAHVRKTLAAYLEEK